MIVTCEKCITCFDLDDSLVKDPGTRVRCSICRHIFTAYPNGAESGQHFLEVKPTIDNRAAAKEKEFKDERQEYRGIGASDSNESIAQPEAVKIAAKNKCNEPEDNGCEIEKKEIEKADKFIKKIPIGRPVITLFVFVILCTGLYFSDTRGIRIFLIDKIGSFGTKISLFDVSKTQPVKDAKNLEISITDIGAKFVNNSAAGKLFILTGNAKDEHSETRRPIRITGNLYSKGKKLEKTETVLCGNTLSDYEITSLDMDSMRKWLSNRGGGNRSKVNVDHGRVIPFMLVFSNLPDHLEEYTIEAKLINQTAIN